MKHRRFSLLKSGGGMLIVCIFTFLATSMKLIKNTSPDYFSSSMQRKDAVCKEIAATRLLKLLQKPGSQGTLEIYPLKNSGNMSNKDFELAVFLKDSQGRALDSTWKGSTEKFQSFTMNYLTFLKQNKISEKSIAVGYRVSVDNSHLKNRKGISICIEIPDGNVKYAFYDLYKTYPPDSCCKCPPQCLYTSLTRAGQVRQAMEKVYQ